MDREVSPSTGNLGDGTLCTLFRPRVLTRYRLFKNCKQHLVGELRDGRQKVLHLVGLVDFGVQRRLYFLEGRPVSVDMPLQCVLVFSEPLDFAVKTCQCLDGRDVLVVDRWVDQLERARWLLLNIGECVLQK